MKHLTTYTTIIALLLLLGSCSNSSERSKRQYSKSSIDRIVTKYIDKDNFSVILADMNYEESNDSYFHKYRIIIPKNQTTSSEATQNDFDVINTSWTKVSPATFDQYQNDLGMTILSKKDGILDKKTAPAGYDNYVGNPKYGEWKTNSNGTSFWAFYGQYAFMRSLFGWGSSYRHYRYDYDDYRDYRGRRSYYGRNNTFGTKTYKNANATWTKKPQSFKQRVQSNVKRSASSQSKGYSSNRSYSNSNQKTTRSSNGFSSSFSRSRSGGFGK